MSRAEKIDSGILDLLAHVFPTHMLMFPARLPRREIPGFCRQHPQERPASPSSLLSDFQVMAE